MRKGQEGKDKVLYNFCTLFDSGYLDKGLVTYYSLSKYCTHFHMYIVAFDEEAYACLTDMKLECCTVLFINDIENDRLRQIKKERSHAEYCWTCSSYITLYIMENMSVDNCTYIDADLMFFSNPERLVDELVKSGDSVLIVGHNYPDTQEYAEISRKFGRYCVQFNTFLNDPRGRRVLEDWTHNCLEKCDDGSDGKTFGDQKYLDDWESDYEGVHILRHKGGGIAPWNIGEYVLKENGSELLLKERSTGDVFPAVFYHYHGFQYKNKYYIDMSSVRRHEKVDLSLLYIIYGTYVSETDKIRSFLINQYGWKNKKAEFGNVGSGNKWVAALSKKLKDRVPVDIIRDFARDVER